MTSRDIREIPEPTIIDPPPPRLHPKRGNRGTSRTSAPQKPTPRAKTLSGDSPDNRKDSPDPRKKSLDYGKESPDYGKDFPDPRSMSPDYR